MLVLLLLAAAATSQPRSAPAPVVRPKALGACAAITADDLQLALGRNFGRGQETAEGPQSTCVYAAGNVQVSVTIQRLAARPDIPAEIEALKRELPGSTARIAPGLGNAAFFLEIPGAGVQLHVIHGELSYLMISILGLGEGAAVSMAAERLARIALPRL